MTRSERNRRRSPAGHNLQGKQQGRGAVQAAGKRTPVSGDAGHVPALKEPVQTSAVLKVLGASCRHSFHFWEIPTLTCAPSHPPSPPPRTGEQVDLRFSAGSAPNGVGKAAALRAQVRGVPEGRRRHLKGSSGGGCAAVMTERQGGCRAGRTALL